MAWSRSCDTRRRKGETTGNTNFDLHRRASLRPYRENLAGDVKGKGTSGSNREAESTDAPERGGLPPGACAGHGLLVVNLEMFRRGQWFAPPPASSSVLITASKLNEAGFWRGGNFLKFSICAATMACIR